MRSFRQAQSRNSGVLAVPANIHRGICLECLIVRSLHERRHPESPRRYQRQDSGQKTRPRGPRGYCDVSYRFLMRQCYAFRPWHCTEIPDA